MLKESFPVTDSGEKSRRWFSNKYFDLIVWIDQNGISGLQLCYDKYQNERALTWTEKDGYSHERIDDGESNPAKNQTPILVPDGLCPIRGLIDRFSAESVEIDPVVRSFVLKKLSEYPVQNANLP